MAVGKVQTVGAIDDCPICPRTKAIISQAGSVRKTQTARPTKFRQCCCGVEVTLPRFVRMQTLVHHRHGGDIGHRADQSVHADSSAKAEAADDVR
jgi:hypothetical protein